MEPDLGGWHMSANSQLAAHNAHLPMPQALLLIDVQDDDFPGGADTLALHRSR